MNRWRQPILALALVLLGVLVSSAPGCYADWAFLRTARLATQYQQQQQQQRPASPPAPSPPEKP